MGKERFFSCINVFCLFKRFLNNEATFKTREFKLHKLEKSPSTIVTVTNKDATLFYKQMLTIRLLEAAAGNLYKDQLIRGFCHLQTNQESCAVGMKAAMRSMDSLISGYRVHGWSYLMGLKIVQIIAELLGKKTGSSKGKGGSMHIYGKNFYGGNGIVGSQVPLGAGVAFAAQYLKTGGVCFTIFGDGAAKQGQVFESFNMAKLWKLPCVFVCENNCQALSLANSIVSASEASLAITDFYSLGDYIPGIKVDGADVLAVREASRFAINHCISGQGPILLELFIPVGNDSSDENSIIKYELSRDPIFLFKERILSASLTTEEELKVLEEDVKKEVDESVMIAKMDNEISLEELTTDVYVHSLENKIRHVNPDD